MLNNRNTSNDRQYSQFIETESSPAYNKKIINVHIQKILIKRFY